MTIVTISRFLFFHMLAIRFYWNDNQRIELVNWCILIFRLFRYSAAFSIRLARLHVVVVVFSFEEKREQKKKELKAKAASSEPIWVHAMRTCHRCTNKIDTKYSHATLTNEMCLQCNDLPKMYGQMCILLLLLLFAHFLSLSHTLWFSLFAPFSDCMHI